MAYLHSFAKALGARCITNADLSALMQTSDEWIQQRSGIKTRYWVEQGTTASDLACLAARQSIELAHATLADETPIEGIVAATLSPDYYFPGIGVLIQKKLGLPTIPSYDIRQQCSGFLYGLEMAQALVDSGKYRRLLLVGAEVHSNGMDLTTRGRDLAVLFGDGAGSCLVDRDPPPVGSDVHPISFEVLGTELHSEGEFAAELWCEAPGSSLPHTALTPEIMSSGRTYPKMNGRKVFEAAVRRMSEVSLSLLHRHGLSVDQVALLVPHQANLRINMAVGEHIGLTPEKVFNTIQIYGNTTAATIPIGVTDAIAAGKIPADANVILAAFGSGFTWGAALLRTRLA